MYIAMLGPDLAGASLASQLNRYGRRHLHTDSRGQASSTGIVWGVVLRTDVGFKIFQGERTQINCAVRDNSLEFVILSVFRYMVCSCHH